MITVAVFDTKSYDRQHLEEASAGRSIQWQFHESRLNVTTAVTAQGAGAVCVFVNDVVDRACLVVLKQLGVKLVALRCAGFNNVDLTAARELGIAVTRVPAYSPYAIAEHTLALLLALNRKIHRAYNRVREHNFSLGGLVGFDLHGKTIGLVGTGKIGRITARICRGFDMQVLAYDPYPDAAWAGTHEVRYTGLDELLASSDIVSLHLPLSPQSRYLLNKETFARMKQGAYLINTSRGKLVDTGALIESLKQGRLGGVALDVYEEEEGVFFEDHSEEVMQDDELSRLLTFPNVLITSHQAFLTKEALDEIARVTAENLQCAAEQTPYLEGSVLVEGVAPKGVSEPQA